MKQINKNVPNGGQATGLNELGDGTRSTLTDANKNWQLDALKGLKLNPDTNQTRLYPIITNTVTGVSVFGRLSEATTLAGNPNYSFSKHTPPTNAQVKTIMGHVQTAFNTAGVKVYYAIDDTPTNDPHNRVLWNYFETFNAMQAWMLGCKDTGGTNEQKYLSFVQLAFVDMSGGAPQAGALSHPQLFGGFVCVSAVREVVKNFAGFPGMSFEKMAGAIAAHELGRCVKCVEPTAADVEENAFTIRYTSTAQAANLTAPGNILYGYTKKARVKCVLDQPPGGQDGFSLDWRQAANDTMQEIVNNINNDDDGQGIYLANLCNPPNKPNRHPCTIVPVSDLNIKAANPLTIKARIDDYIMTIIGPGIISLKFNLTWTTSIKNRMDVAGHW